MACELEIEVEEHKFRVLSYPATASHLQFQVPSLAAASFLAGQLGRGDLREFLRTLDSWSCFGHVQVDIVYRNQVLMSRSLAEYLSLDVLWFLSRQWRRLLD